MESKAVSFKTLIDKSNNILLTFPFVINSDVCASIGLISKYLKSINKKVVIASSRDIPKKYTEILEVCGIDPTSILKEIKPISYIISVNETDENMDINWQTKGDKVQFVLTPEEGEIDFSKISFGREGGIYDLVITFNANRLHDLGTLYTNNTSVLKKYDIASLNSSSKNDKYSKLSVRDEETSTLSETVYKLLQDLNYDLEKKDAKVLVEGILGSTYGLHRAGVNSYKVVSELISEYKVDPCEINLKYFYSLSKSDISLREKLLSNTKFEDNKKVIYSSLTKNDFNSLGLNPSDLDGMDYLPFNTCEGYDYAFLAYEQDDKSTILIHANNAEKDLQKLLKKINGFGNRNYGIIILNDTLHDAISKVLSTISGENIEQPLFEEKTTSNSTENESKPKVEEEKSEFTKSGIPTSPQTTPDTSNKLSYYEDESKVETEKFPTDHPTPDLVEAIKEQKVEPSPFTKAEDYTIDPNAPVSKKPGTASPFEKANPSI